MQRLIWLIQKPDVSDSKQYVNNKHVRDRLNIEPRNSMLSQFDNLKNVSTENKEELRELVNSYQNEFAKASVKTNKVSNIIIQIICGIPTTIVICFVFIISLISFISNSFYILLNFVPRSFEKNIILVILLYLLFYCLILFLFTYPIVIIIRYLPRAFRSLTTNLIRSYMMTYYTVPYITYGLVSIIDTAEKEPEGFMRMDFKRELLLGLEKVALCIELYLPGQFHHHDSITDAWLRERTKQWSTALREKKKWILTPKEDTLEYFVESITFTLICFVDGNWDALERIEPENIARPPLRKSISTFLLHMLKIILKIAIPVGSFLVLQQTPLALTGATLVSVISMLSLYVVTVLASDLNPDFNARISNVKDIMSLLPGNGSKL